MSESVSPQDAPCTTTAGPLRGSSILDELVIVTDFANAQGGATVIALQQAREFRRQGFKVTYICGDKPSEELDRLGVTQVSLKEQALLDLPRWRAVSQGLHNVAAERMLASWISRHDTPRTVYHLHNWSQILSPAVFEALKPVEDRLVVTCHDFFNICPNGGFIHFNESRPCGLRPLSAACLLSQCDRRSPAHKYWRALRHMQLNRLAEFDRSRATYTFLHDLMQARFVDRGFAAPDRITLPNPVEAWSSQRIEAERNQGFIFVGRIGRDKGADLAIGAARATGQKLVLVGAGEFDPTDHIDGTNIEFAGWQDRAGIAKIARNARALIVPSRIVEPFGLVLLEAALSGLPVIVSSHAFMAGDVATAGFGRTFDIGQSRSLEDLLSLYARDDALIRQMSLAGFEKARSLCHTPESWADELTAIFERKLQSGAKPHRT